MRIQIEYKSIIGSREEQQDAYYTFSCGNSAFAVVCDGMGGTKSGLDAGKTTVNKFKELISTKSSDESYPEFFLRAIDILDENAVKLQRKSGTNNSGTTIVAAAIENDNLYWFAVGDSRLYIIRGSEIVQATRDHNVALSLEQWNPDELKTAKVLPGVKRADALISFIGIGGVKIYDINEKAFSLLRGDKILLTTDGLTKALDNNEILKLLKDNEPSEKLNKLFEKAAEKSNGTQDNTTCVLIQVN